ncbi:MAG: glycosyltransferase family 2 protein [Capsulimonadaceae bacterium]|nr:glycosyltransferase family 2 protein [Capsulimonadaceae bacterium]
MNTPPAVSALILAKNEAEFIERCIRSVQWAGEVVVLDSGSTDGTQEIARSLGATIYEQEWLGWSAQHDRAMQLAQNDWVFVIDCDEIVTPELRNSIEQTMEGQPDPKDGFAVVRQGDFLGVLLPSKSRPAKIMKMVRLFNRQYGKWDAKQLVHEEVIVAGRTHLLEGKLIHWRGYMMDEYVSAFNRYATIEAKVLDDQHVHANGALIVTRTLLRFFWQYIWQQEWKLGVRGLIHSLMKAYAEFVRYAKLWEMQNAPRCIHPPSDI